MPSLEDLPNHNHNLQEDLLLNQSIAWLQNGQNGVDVVRPVEQESKKGLG